VTPPRRHDRGRHQRPIGRRVVSDQRARRGAGGRRGGTTLQLPATTIDRIVCDLSLPKVDFIKMDIEGAERRAIPGSARTVASFRPRMALCLYHLPDDPEVIPAAVRAIEPSDVFPEVAHVRPR
jgi:hypothetical protein